MRALAKIRKDSPNVFGAIRSRKLTRLEDAKNLVREFESRDDSSRSEPDPSAEADRAIVLERYQDRKGAATVNGLIHDLQRERRRGRMSLALPAGQRYAIHHGRMQDLASKVEDASINLVFADPPYGSQGRGLAAAIAEIAARVLVRGGLLALTPGHVAFHAAAAASARCGLAPVAIGCIAFRGGVGGGLRHKKLVQKVDCDPVAFFCQGGEPVRPVSSLIYESDGIEKDLLDWQKPLSAMIAILHAAVGDGGRVLDPCCGSATTGEAALRLGHEFIGFEVEEERAAASASRLAAAERALRDGNVVSLPAPPADAAA